MRVLAAVLGAVDRGCRAVIAADAICGSCDETHDALPGYHGSRSAMQTADTDEVLDAWA